MRDAFFVIGRFCQIKRRIDTYWTWAGTERGLITRHVVSWRTKNLENRYFSSTYLRGTAERIYVMNVFTLRSNEYQVRKDVQS